MRGPAPRDEAALSCDASTSTAEPQQADSRHWGDAVEQDEERAAAREQQEASAPEASAASTAAGTSEPEPRRPGRKTHRRAPTEEELLASGPGSDATSSSTAAGTSRATSPRTPGCDSIASTSSGIETIDEDQEAEASGQGEAEEEQEEQLVLLAQAHSPEIEFTTAKAAPNGLQPPMMTCKTRNAIKVRAVLWVLLVSITCTRTTVLHLKMGCWVCTL